jgi:hypothetical protein
LDCEFTPSLSIPKTVKTRLLLKVGTASIVKENHFDANIAANEASK